MDIKLSTDEKEKAFEYRKDKENLIDLPTRQSMKFSGGKSNPQLIYEILKKKL